MLWRGTKKIKLIVSDFHVGEGRLLEDGSVNLMEDFIYDHKFIEFLQHYSSGDYQGYQVEMIINGDFFNMLQLDCEGQNPARVTEKISIKTMEKIMRGHSGLLDALREFVEKRACECHALVGGSSDCLAETTTR